MTTARRHYQINDAIDSLNTSVGALFMFKTIVCPAGTNPVADSATDTLTLTAGSNKITITGDSAADSVTLNVAESNIDHGSIAGLADDDHSQYHNDARGDARYYTETELDAGQLDNRYFTEAEHLDSSAGAGDAGKPTKLDAAGHIDATMINDADIDHANLTNTHNLTTDIDHDALTNFTSTEHFTMLDEDDLVSNSNTQTATQQSIKAYADALLIAPVEVLDAVGGNVIAKIDVDGNLYIKGRVLKLS